jgi:hypothetical protein
MDLTGYKNLIDPQLLDRVKNNTHTMADMPYYPKNYEINMVEKRYKELCDAYSKAFQTPTQTMSHMGVLMGGSQNGMESIARERGNREELIILAEKIVREQFNLGEDEVEFDIDIVEVGKCKFHKDMNITKTIPENFKQSENKDIIKKRTINALSQGAAKKSHYIFHLYHDEINAIVPDITNYYQRAFTGNDLLYFALNDNLFSQYVQGNGSGNNAGYVRLDFSGKIPVIEAKGINMPLLIHEMTKGVISLLSVPGIQNMSQGVIDETDFIMSEIWEIRFGATLWETFHSNIDVDDYDIKKVIIMNIFNMPSDEFINFMDDVVNDPEKSKKTVSNIAKKIRIDKMNYDFEANSED